MTKICIPIVEKNIDTLIEKIFLASQKADIIELWLGEIFPNGGGFAKNGEKYLEKIFEAKKECNNIPLLLNVKDEKEKGNFIGTNEEKFSILQKGAQMRAEYIDIDFEFEEKFLSQLKISTQEKNSQLILSAHFFDGTPSFPALKNRVQRMQNAGADIVKIAAMPENNRDILSILRLSENLSRKQIPFITMSMAEKGKFSRIICPLFGSHIAFGSLDKSSASASGQMTADEVKEYLEKFSLFPPFS